MLALQLRSNRPNVSSSGNVPINVPPPTNNYPTNTGGDLPQIPNSRVLVVIDPGHGGKDPGTVGIGGVYEKNIILPISQEVSQILQRQGVRVMMTRNSDYFVSLQGRAQMANQARANVFVSIHANAISLSRPDVNGLETFYHQSGKELAQTIHRNILRRVDIGDRGVKQARFYVLRRTSMPSALVEVGFLTGQIDHSKLTNPAFRSQMAQGIAAGILEYIQKNRL
jgi:N-acetylmuramoyl-L-alanine amidase